MGRNDQGAQKLSPEEEQEQWLKDAVKVVKQQAFYMNRALDNGNLRDALKHSSNMICELRTSLLSPKRYYNLYMHVFDELRNLESHFDDEQKKGRRMIELYELVQHAGNILPRLYLLSTVGSAYIKSKQAPARDVLKDLVEMDKGVQHPMRGLFLRNYLSQISKDKLPDAGSEYEGEGGSTKDSVDFILVNFTEMNKLWVRMQHQGPVRNRDKREKERLDLRILVGTNLVRLSQLEGVDMDMYKDVVLPRVLEQVVNCKDQIAQQYLMDCIIHVFPDENHLQTLELILNTCTQLQSGVDLKTILTGLMNRLSSYAAADGVAIPDDYKIFNLFTTYVAKVIQSTKMELADILHLQVALLNFALRTYPNRLDYVDHVLGFCSGILTKMGHKVPKLGADTIKSIVELLSLPLEVYRSILIVLDLANYPDLMGFLEFDRRKEVATKIISNILDNRTRIEEAEKVEQLFAFIRPLVEGDPDNPLKAVDGDDKEDFEHEQGLVARVVHFVDHADTDVLYATYAGVAKQFIKGGDLRMRYTIPSLVFNLLQLVRRIRAREEAAESGEEGTSEIGVPSRKVFKIVHELCSKLTELAPELALRMFLQCAQVADAVRLEEIAYEFMTQCFIVYEDELSDSRAQLAAVTVITGTVETLVHFSEENFDTLITKATQHAAKLLKKPDQTRAVANASHLFWCEEHREEQRVLECLQRSLKIANACLDTKQQTGLFVDVLNHYLYYLDAGNEKISVDHVRELLKLVYKQLEELGDDEGEEVRTHFKNTLVHIKQKKASEEPGPFAEINI